MDLKVVVSWGELLDKISILEIKSERIQDREKCANVLHELSLLTAVRDAHIRHSDILKVLLDELKSVNESLWDIEDRIRLCEKHQDFGEKFIELARSVYFTNDRRAALKYQLNQLLGSTVVEEKSYQPYSEVG